MNPDFKAAYCVAEDMDTYFVVWLSDDQHGPSDYLTFQRGHEFDEQDIRLGLNAVYVERNAQGYSGYRGMSRVDLYADRLQILFNDKGARFMGGTAAMTVGFELSADGFDSLRAGLHWIFAGFDYVHDHTNGDSI